jgi:pantothenate kinase
MDRFHLDNRILIERDRLVEKGAPDTFDAGGFLNMVAKDHSLDGVGDPAPNVGENI